MESYKGISYSIGTTPNDAIIIYYNLISAIDGHTYFLKKDFDDYEKFKKEAIRIAKNHIDVFRSTGKIPEYPKANNKK